MGKCDNASCRANKCIECDVTECMHHAEGEDYCSLDKIKVGTHEANPTECKCTDCESFERA